MADKMLIDATHPEETRVVVLRGNRVEEFDFESANRKQLRGNIYLAKVTRVEPSLQAAFVDYGGNRHGFLAFSEIHPDYYQIPVADRQALLEQEERDQRAADADADHRANRRGGRGRHRHRGADRHRGRDVRRSESLPAQDQPIRDLAPQDFAAEDFAHENAGSPASEAALGEQTPEQIADTAAVMAATTPAAEHEAEELVREAAGLPADEPVTEAASQPQATEAQPPSEAAPSDQPPESSETPQAGDDHGESGDHLPASAEAAPAEDRDGQPEPGNGEEASEEDAVESVGGADALEEVQERVPRFRRQYKIQEVIKRRQVMLVQVVKEERGTKGAALTTYLSLAGRYSVLMPNTARGGGISRKITSSEDRARLKDIAQELETPPGMGVILRTAGASRTKTEVKRDFEYLLRLWETVRDLTLKSTAPKLVYEEGSLAKRSIRDLYSKDIEEIVVAGEDGYKECKDFMRMLMPSHVKHVKLYKDSQPIFTRYGIESQLDAMFSPVVQLRSGGYIVINQAEALVAIDVNSGRATREHHIEDTALKTNGEAAEEIARQLRLRDLAGLIVIDFIDMDEMRNNRTVERRLKDALKHDRARIQVGRISHFGLLEMSRQRIRSSVLESSTEKCPVCGGSGHVRSVSSVSLQLLRALEEMLIKGATHNLIVRTRSEVALYVLNHKRAHLRVLEERFRITITISADATVTGQQSYIIDRGEQVHSVEAARSLAAAAPALGPLIEEDEEIFEAEAEGEPESGEAHEVPQTSEAAPPEASGEPRREGGRRRRRRGRGHGGEPREVRDGAPEFTHETMAEHAIAHEDYGGGAPEQDDSGQPQQAHQGGAQLGGEGTERDGGRRRRRRGRRGGRRNRRDRGNGDAPFQSSSNDNNGGNGGNGDAPFQPHGGEVEPDLRHAVEDLDRPPPREGSGAERPSHAGRDFPPVSGEDADAMAPRFDRQPEAAPAKTAPAEPETSPEPPRRRSTVREPASFAAEAPPPSPTLPPPTPVISSTAGESTAPKRGWWAKRLMGDKD